jgi:hypothetical protein
MDLSHSGIAVRLQRLLLITGKARLLFQDPCADKVTLGHRLINLNQIRMAASLTRAR